MLTDAFSFISGRYPLRLLVTIAVTPPSRIHGHRPLHRTQPKHQRGGKGESPDNPSPICSATAVKGARSAQALSSFATPLHRFVERLHPASSPAPPTSGHVFILSSSTSRATPTPCAPLMLNIQAGVQNPGLKGGAKHDLAGFRAEGIQTARRSSHNLAGTTGGSSVSRDEVIVPHCEWGKFD